ncbi:CsbD family protein [Tropicimonas isoalkanivorans]|uniref:Uncharacterized conserved protein YjbJ, UPF0337 family n=1 Tax=Tropicimonas isoalkanivorans TaxID=441112 RepID=A0A1I1P1V9_9RHOB|nr:Uncharacterized conserved protein YjbJ, UPF0337 family [Tropicimonas isoalkanivorans]
MPFGFSPMRVNQPADRVAERNIRAHQRLILQMARRLVAPLKTEDSAMNWDQVQGNWKQMKGKMVESWGKLTDDEVTQAQGDREQFEGLIQEKYGKTKEEARQEVDNWLAKN